MADLGIIFLRRKHTIHWYQSLFTILTGSMPFRYLWATLYIIMLLVLTPWAPLPPPHGNFHFRLDLILVLSLFCAHSVMAFIIIHVLSIDNPDRSPIMPHWINFYAWTHIGCCSNQTQVKCDLLKANWTSCLNHSIPLSAHHLGFIWIWYSVP